MNCRFCGKEYKRPCGLAIHERVCKSNPNRRPLENSGNGWKFANKRRKRTDGNVNTVSLLEEQERTYFLI